MAHVSCGDRAGCILAQEGAKRQRGPTELVSLCDVPFVLTPEAKGNIFKIEAALQMHHQMHSFGVNVRPLPKFLIIVNLLLFMPCMHGYVYWYYECHSLWWSRSQNYTSQEVGRHMGSCGHFRITAILNAPGTLSIHGVPHRALLGCEFSCVSLQISSDAAGIYAEEGCNYTFAISDALHPGTELHSWTAKLIHLKSPFTRAACAE